MGNFDPNLLPFESLEYHAARLRRFAVEDTGQQYKRYRDKSIEDYHKSQSDTIKNSLKIFAIALGDEEIRNIIFDNIDKFHKPTDLLNYYCIDLYTGYTSDDYPLIFLSVTLPALSKDVRKEFTERFKFKEEETTEHFSSTHPNTIFYYSTSPRRWDKNFADILKFFLERSEFIPVNESSLVGTIMYRFIFERRYNKISLKWKTIKELKDFLVSIDTDLPISSETEAFISLVKDGESKQYKPSDEVYYFCIYDRDNKTYHLKRDLYKSPKKDKRNPLA